MPKDKESPSRILIIGKSGSGKSTLARTVSQHLSIPHIELDTLYWKPHWIAASKPEMRANVDAALPADGAWIADGNIISTADITWPRAQLIIWLDYPVLLALWRLFWRTLRRIWTREEVCNGNVEDGRALLGLSSRDNVLLMCLAQRRIHAKAYPRMLKEYGEGEGKVRHFKSERQCLEWLDALKRSKCKA